MLKRIFYDFGLKMEPKSTKNRSEIDPENDEFRR